MILSTRDLVYYPGAQPSRGRGVICQFKGWKYPFITPTAMCYSAFHTERHKTTLFIWNAFKEINRIHIIIFAQNIKLNKNSSRKILYIST
jgi:hypothetical protein